jgi:hypothetical protein
MIWDFRLMILDFRLAENEMTPPQILSLTYKVSEAAESFCAVSWPRGFRVAHQKVCGDAQVEIPTVAE